ncbi:lipid-A-disaccharide synthase [Nitratifractor sp.]
MKILVSAIEHSANIHLKEVVKRLPSETELVGIFDRELGEPMEDLRSLAVMGITDALRKLPFFFRLADRMVELAGSADKVLLIDGSGFNLPLAKKIKKRYPHKEIVYYILPQAWAWRRYRIKTLERTVDHLASILPFEERYYSPSAPIHYVGHPLLDEISRFKETPSEAIRTIAFLPGSRRSEIRTLMPLFRKLRRRLGESLDARVVIPPIFSPKEIEELYGDLSGFRREHDTHRTLFESDFAFVCSGTATLEAALIGTPLVLAYRAKPLDYFLASRLIRIEYAGLANLFSLDFQGRPMHPELLQDDLTIDNLLREYEAFDRKRYAEDVQKLRRYLRHGSAENVARLLSVNGEKGGKK